MATARFRPWPAHVYVVSDGNGRHKIGTTAQDMRRRLYQLGRDLGRPVSLVHVEEPIAFAEAAESAAHWDLCDQHDQGEWFTVSAERAIEAVRRAVEKVTRGELPEHRLPLSRHQYLGARLEGRIRKAMGAAESRAEFIREAVEREIKRRSRTPSPKP